MAETARLVAERLHRLAPVDALLAVGPPWWLGIAARIRAAALDPDPPRWLVCPEADPVARDGRDDAHILADLDALARAEADWIGRPGALLADVRTARDLTAWLESLSHAARHRRRCADARRVSVGVVLVHHDRPRWLGAALDSLRAQTRPPDQVVVVDAASSCPRARAALDALAAREDAFPMRVLWRAESSLGAARGVGVDALDMDWVLFMDDDNIAPPGAVEDFARAAATESADIWTCWAALFAGEAPPSGGSGADGWYRPLGPVPGLLARGNNLGDANMLVRRAAFRALGGFDPDPTVGAEDWDFLVRAWLAGVRQGVIPRPLVWKRLSPDSMSRTMDHDRARTRVVGRLRAGGLPV
ncbi:glycosyltransferase family 2 protein [Rhodospira trueperi]|uniref:glycosyltransferase family 2 protein n=1 Tax=Rhodospira trueperi TaxID=69960 RepID=UPI0015A0095F|nr:glycosyltransferase [Rhodospira trueperi]